MNKTIQIFGLLIFSYAITVQSQTPIGNVIEGETNGFLHSYGLSISKDGQRLIYSNFFSDGSCSDYSTTVLRQMFQGDWEELDSWEDEGYSVDLNTDGTRILIGNQALNNCQGGVTIYDSDSNLDYTNEGTDRAGATVRLNSIGNRFLVASKNTSTQEGVVEVYNNSFNFFWNRLGFSFSGTSGDISSSGDTILVYDDSVTELKSFEWSGSAWVQIGQTLSDDEIGTTSKLSSNGKTIITAFPESGNWTNCAKIYSLENDQWIQSSGNVCLDANPSPQLAINRDDQIAINHNGNIVLLSYRNEVGAFELVGEEIVQLFDPIENSDNGGYTSVDIDSVGNRFVIGWNGKAIGYLGEIQVYEIQKVIHPDFDPLLSLYAATDGENWTNNSGWADGAAGLSCDPCTDGWYGVTCENGRVTCLDLDGELSCLDVNTGIGNNLVGSIPEEIGSLDSLKVLSLDNNQLSGELPSSIGSLSKLELLSLSRNELSGIISSEIGSLLSLKHLYLDFNPWDSQSIPVFLAQLEKLENLSITNANLVGELPLELGQLTNLKSIAFGSDDVTGQIPQEYSALDSLVVFICQECELYGELPEFFGELPNFDALWVENNNFEGCFPASYKSLCGGPMRLSGNDLLPWQGDFQQFCLTDGSQTSQIGASCDDGDINTANEVIQRDCECREALPFITTWKTDNTTSPCNTCVFIPGDNSFNFDVDWENDGVYDEFNLLGNQVHDYGVAGTFDVAIRGYYPYYKIISTNVYRNKLIDVKQWGDIQWMSFSEAFRECDSLYTFSATDSPDLSQVTDMSFMFTGSDNFNADLSNWDVSNVVDMRVMFSDCPKFNGDITTWNTSSLEQMQSILADCDSFNQDLSNWTISNVSNLSGFMAGSDAFNQNLNSWDVTNVTNFSGAFVGADNFNQDLSNWNVSNGGSFKWMFQDAVSFNQDLSSWSLSSATDVTFMLDSCAMSVQNYEATLNGWAANPNTPSNLELGAESLEYCDDSGRNILINDLGWTIVGDVKANNGNKLGGSCQYPINAETDLGDPNLYYLECGEEYILNPVDGLCEDLNATCSNGTTWYYFQVDQDIPEFSIIGGVFELFEGPINNLPNGIEHDCTGLVSLGCDEGNFYTDPTKGYFLLIELGPVTVSGSKQDELVNDDCPSAIFLQEGSGSYFGDNSCATGDVNTCHVGTDGDGHVIYYLYSTGDAPEDITITINSQGNGSMTQGSISVFDDCLGTTTLTQIWDQQNGTGQLCSALDDANGVQLSCVPANTFMNIAIGSDGRPWQTNGPGPTLPGRFVLNLDVTLSEPLPLVTGGPTEICNDSSAELSVSLEDGSTVGTLIVTPAANSNIAGATDHAFENGAGFISDILINNTSVAQTQIYDAYLDISDSNCPVSLSQIEVTVFPQLEVSFQSNEIIVPFSTASSYELIPGVIGGFGNNYQYSWSDGSTGPNIDLQNPVDNQLSQVCVTITDDLGCESEACAELVYEEPTCRYRDSLALVALYNSTNGADWFNTWDLDQPITTWFGISISEEGCVTCIDMDGDPDCISDDIGPGGNNLTGILTDSLAQLSQLEYLILQNNSIGGNLLDWQGLNNLILYNIQYSKLSDTIPDFSGMPNLERLVLSNNNLEGEIPNFSGMPKLMRLFITDNNLEGEIPNFSNIPLLDNFSFKSNQLSGPIPDFQFCPELTGFNVWYNNLTGPVPNFQLPKATQLFIGWNALDGEVPDFDGMPLLFELQMQIGNLTGNIPTFENCPNLQIANFRVNNLSGCYPIQLLDNLCNKSYNFTENTLLPWEGDMTSFCNGDNQIGAQCNDGDTNTLTEEIDEDCVCREVCPIPNAGESFPSTHCEGDPPIDFFAQMFNFDSGGVWEDPISTGVNLSNPLLVDISGLSADTYEFYYIIGDTEGCPRDTNRVIVLINQNSESEVTLESCTGEPIVVNGQSYMESTEVDVLDQNVLGCDSIIHYEISIYQNFEEPYQAVGCDGDIVEINGQNYTFIGGQDLEIQQLLSSVEYPACDSILNITLIGVADQETDLIQTLCNDDMYQVGPDIYDLGNPSGTTTLFGEASNGCDSIVQVDIAFLPLFSATKTAEICFGESYSFNGVEYMQSGIYQDTIVGVAQMGCDSLYMLDLEFLPQSIETFNSVACIGDVELIGSEMILVNKGSILDTTFTYPGMSQFGCDSILRVIIDPLPLGESEITGYLCGSQEVVIENDTFDLDRLSDVVISQFSAYNGCDSLLYVAFEYLDEVVAEDDFFSSNTRFFTLDPLANDSYDQSSDITIELNSNPKVDSISFENMDEIEVVLLIGVTDTVSFDYILCDELCGVCDTANIVLLKSDSGFVDDVVTCNNDGTNDSFILSEVKENLADDFPCNKINIFNRWGQPVYTASPYDNDWCGTFMDTGRTLPEGTYYFELDLFGDRACDESTFNLGATSLFYGSITVLR